MADNSFLSDEELARLLASGQQINQLDYGTQKQLEMAKMMRQMGTMPQSRPSGRGVNIAPTIPETLASSLMQGMAAKRMMGAYDQQGQIGGLQAGQNNMILSALLRNRGKNKLQLPGAVQGVAPVSSSPSGAYDPYQMLKEPNDT